MIHGHTAPSCVRARPISPMIIIVLPMTSQPCAVNSGSPYLLIFSNASTSNQPKSKRKTKII